MENSNAESEEMQGFANVLNHMYSFIEPMVLKCAVQLGLPDIVHSHGRAITLTELVAALPFESVNEDRLCRIMRYLVHMRLFTVRTTEDGKTAYGLTPACKFLTRDGENSLAALALAITDEAMVSASHCLSACVDGNSTATPFETKHGRKIWEMVAHRPEFNQLFNEGMAAETRAIMSAVVRDGKAAFQTIESLVDVGGGTGMATGFIARAFPHIKCAVLDLPFVVATAREYPNVTFIPGDMFSSVPLANAVFMKNVLHDWGDEDCVKILKRCKEAIPKEGGRVILVEMIVDLDEEDMFSTLRLKLDMGMAVLTTGKERSKQQWKTLLQTAGFNTFSIIPISSPQSVIEAYPS